eukprot:3507430-Rhodomonas_salina.7
MVVDSRGWFTRVTYPCLLATVKHGHKSWLIYSASTNCIYSSTSCTFDETLFPAKLVDQSVFGYYNTASVTQFSTDMHKQHLNSTLAADLPNLSSVSIKLWPADDVCIDADALNSILSEGMTGMPDIEGTSINISSSPPSEAPVCTATN